MASKRKSRRDESKHTYVFNVPIVATKKLSKSETNELKDAIQNVVDDVVGVTGALWGSLQRKLDRVNDVELADEQQERQAICLPYATEQNEPSRPIKKIITLPANKRERDRVLKELFIEHVCEDATMEEIVIIKSKDKDDYGDLVVSYGDDLFMFVTFL